MGLTAFTGSMTNTADSSTETVSSGYLEDVDAEDNVTRRAMQGSGRCGTLPKSHHTS
jgi:hypothetical protein